MTMQKEPARIRQMDVQIVTAGVPAIEDSATGDFLMLQYAIVAGAAPAADGTIEISFDDGLPIRWLLMNNVKQYITMFDGQGTEYFKKFSVVTPQFVVAASEPGAVIAGTPVRLRFLIGSGIRAHKYTNSL